MGKKFYLCLEDVEMIVGHELMVGEKAHARESFLRAFSFKFVTTTSPVGNDIGRQLTTKMLVSASNSCQLVCSLRCHAPSLNESINFSSVIWMNNYDVNLCITNLRLPNGGVAVE